LSHKKAESFGDWYSELVVSSELISYYDVSGCYILRPWAFAMWEVVQRWYDDQIKQMGIQNAYFPLFITQDVLETEKDHVEGFAPEVAWVTKYGNTEMEKPIAIRPTSETVRSQAVHHVKMMVCMKWKRVCSDLCSALHSDVPIGGVSPVVHEVVHAA
jgi:prolyl-tRNA synthetase